MSHGSSDAVSDASSFLAVSAAELRMLERQGAERDLIGMVCGVPAAEVLRRCEVRRRELAGAGVGGRRRHGSAVVAVTRLPLAAPARRQMRKMRHRLKAVWYSAVAFTRELGEVLAALPKLGRMRRQIKELRAELKALQTALDR